MTWFKVDDSFYDHPKIFDAPDCAVALWTRAGTWSARNLTDGFVPAGMPARLCDDPDTAVRQLMTRGLWKRTRGGYQFHDWAEYQPSAEAVKTLREKRVEAGRRGGRAKAENRLDHSVTSDPTIRTGGVTEPSRTRRNATTSEDGPDSKQTASKSLASASPVAKQNAAPTRPDLKIFGGRSNSATYDRAHAASEPPSPRCPQHLEEPDPPPCGPCGDARRARTRWDLADAERRRNAPKCRSHRGQPADNCALCRSEALAVQEVP